MANIEPIEPTSGQTMNDDQELAKVLAGVSQQADDAATAGTGSTFDAGTSATDAPTEPSDDASAATDDATLPEPVIPTLPEPVASDSSPVDAPIVNANGDLDSIKQQALNELQPLVGKLDVSPEEKFDTYLLLLRTTDDRSLIAPAHEAAKNIADEARRAQALLDIIKEIDFLSAPK
jgi:hypothetical protein